MKNWGRTIQFLLWFSIRMRVSLTVWVTSCSLLAVAVAELRVPEAAGKGALQIAVVLSAAK
jgi:hypothetical protein